MTAKQKRFGDEYCVDLNQTQAAIRAGYSKKTAYAIGWENLRKPEIQKYIEERLNERALSSEAAIKRTADMARGNLADYFTKRMVVRHPRIEITLKTHIAELKKQVQFEEEYLALSCKNKDEKKSYLNYIAGLKDNILRRELELKHNPKARIIVDGPDQLTETMELDLVKIAADKERGIIKSVKHTEFGVQVEMYGADSALTNILKMHGKFEKHNEQKRPVVIQPSDDQFSQILKQAREASSNTGK